MSRSVLASVLAGWVLLSGCINQEPVTVEEPQTETEMRLKYLRLAYLRHLRRQHAPPRSLEDIKPQLAQLKEREGAPADMLISPRDNKPFEICWGVDITKADAGKPLVWAYEKEGSEGLRYVLEGQQQLELLSDAQFRAATFPPGHTPTH